MAVDSYGPKRQPRFSDSGAPDIAVDPTAVADYAAEFGNYSVGTTAERTAASAWAWEGLTWTDTNGDKTRWIYTGGSWVAISRIPGNVGADGNQTIADRVLFRTGDGMVTAGAASTRTGSTTYATALIVGVLPIGFRPAMLWPGAAVTYGSGSVNAVLVEPATGIVRLAAPSPAGHTVARWSVTFPV